MEKLTDIFDEIIIDEQLLESTDLKKAGREEAEREHKQDVEQRIKDKAKKKRMLELTRKQRIKDKMRDLLKKGKESHKSFWKTAWSH